MVWKQFMNLHFPKDMWMEVGKYTAEEKCVWQPPWMKSVPPETPEC